MNILNSEPRAERVRFDESDMIVELKDGRKLSVPLAYFPRLLHAPVNDLESYVLSGGGVGIHWENIDEDISVEGLFLGVGDRSDHQSLAVAEEPEEYGRTCR